MDRSRPNPSSPPPSRRTCAQAVADWLRNHGLQALAVGKLGKALLLATIGFGSLRLIDRDLAEVAREWAFLLRIDPENHVLRIVLDKLSAVDAVNLRHFGLWSLFFAADQVAEGIGLWFDQAWAKYLM
ncbi:MAG: DUF2127 domain-containing protein, partial [Opitutaceae bacterium]